MSDHAQVRARNRPRDLTRVFLDLTHVGRHVTGIERVAIEQFEKTAFDGAELHAVRAAGVASMILKQQLLLPLLALIYPQARFIFPGFPPSPFFALIPDRVTLYVHDTFLLSRRGDLSAKARLYMAPQFSLAVSRLKHFFVNSEKTGAELKEYTRPDAEIALYRPTVANHFALDVATRSAKPAKPLALKLVSLGTVEPRKNYAAAVAILDAVRTRFDADAELHIIGRAGWGDAGAAIADHPGITVHGYLPASGVKAVLEAADIYLCTSHDEGLGLPLIEAQFAGLPVVAPDKPVFREVLAGSATLIDTEQPEAAADAIRGLIANPDWRSEEALKATRNVARWNAAAAQDLILARSAFSGPATSGSAAPAPSGDVRPSMTKKSPSRRDVLEGFSGAVAAAALKAPPADAATPADSLAAIAAGKGILFGASFAVHELQEPHGKQYAEMYVRDARVLTSELEFKLATLRPTPDKIDFYDADRLVQFAETHGMRVRAHTLIWNDALPDWIKKLPDADVRDLLDAHVETVTTRFGNKIAFWDVVNEPIGPWDRNPGNLRGGPFYRALGEGYIKRAFEVARRFAPEGTLVLNEAQTETNDGNGRTFRDSLLALLKRLKAEGVPIDAIGIQSHIQAAKPYDFQAYAGYLAEIADLGYAIHITELDVNDTGIDGSIAERDAKVADLYERYLGAVLQLKAVKVVELWQLSDATSWMNDRSSIGRLDVRAEPRPLIYDRAFQKKPAWDAVARALSDAPSRSA